MISIKKDYVDCEFPDVHADASAAIRFERTLRIPDDGLEYPLPPGLGAFPLCAVAHHSERVPASWQTPNAAMLSMWPSEALWLDFTWCSYPCAIKVGAGDVNAITGAPMTEPLQEAPQDYVVVPDQRWLDGFVVAKGLVRQFVATPLGHGRSVAEQLSTQGYANGLQLLLYPMTGPSYERFNEDRQRCKGISKPMVMAAGGTIRQEVYQDLFGIEAWTTAPALRIDVHLVPARAWRSLTGRRPPARAPTAKTYTDAGLPWFDYYDARTPAVDSQPALSDIRSLGALQIDRDAQPPPPSSVRRIGPHRRP